MYDQEKQLDIGLYTLNESLKRGPPSLAEPDILHPWAQNVGLYSLLTLDCSNPLLHLGFHFEIHVSVSPCLQRSIDGSHRKHLQQALSHFFTSLIIKILSYLMDIQLGMSGSHEALILWVPSQWTFWRMLWLVINSPLFSADAPIPLPLYMTSNIWLPYMEGRIGTFVSNN